MLWPEIIAAALLTVRPAAHNADRIGQAIADATGDDRNAAALLVVIGSRESGWEWSTCSCRVAGLGGALGCYQLDPEIWGRACGSIERQTAKALGAIQTMGWPGLGPAGTLQRYLGARSPEHHEVMARGRLYWTVRERLKLAACI